MHFNINKLSGIVLYSIVALDNLTKIHTIRRRENSEAPEWDRNSGSGLRESLSIMVTVASGHVHRNLYRVVLCILEGSLFRSSSRVQLLSIPWKSMPLSPSKLIMLFIRADNSMCSQWKLLQDDHHSYSGMFSELFCSLSYMPQRQWTTCNKIAIWMPFAVACW